MAQQAAWRPPNKRSMNGLMRMELPPRPYLQGSRDKMLDPAAVGGYALGGFPTYLYLDRDMKFYSGHTGFSDEYVRQKIEEGLQ